MTLSFNCEFVSEKQTRKRRANFEILLATVAKRCSRMEVTMKTEYIAHRINTKAELLQLPEEYGVELDLRDDLNGRI